MPALAEFTVDANTLALWHMDGTLASADKKDNAEGTAGRDLLERNTPSNSTGFNAETDGAYSLASASSEDVYTGSESGLAMGAGNFTIEGWWKIAAAGSVSTALYNRNKATSAFEGMYTYLLGTDSGGDAGKVQFNIRNSSGTVQTATSSVSIADDSWHYVALVRNGNSTLIYVDGVERANVNHGSTLNIGSLTIPTYIGSIRGGSGFLTGIVDEVRWSNIARTAQEISDYYNGAAAAFTPRILIF